MSRLNSIIETIWHRFARLEPRGRILGGRFRGEIDLVEDRSIQGWLMNDVRARHRFLVEAVTDDGTVLAEATASTHRGDLLSACLGDGNYGFELRIHSRRKESCHVTVREAESGIVIGSLTLPRSAAPSLEYQIVEAQLDRKFYLSAYPDVAALKMDPVYHYLTYGFREGRTPVAGFDPKLYDSKRGLEGSDVNPLVHRGLATIREMARQVTPQINGAAVRDSFDNSLEYQIVAAQLDREFYTSVYPDLRTAGVDPVRHYIEHGCREGRNPSPHFGTEIYRRQHKLEENKINPLVHRGLELIRRPELKDRDGQGMVESGCSLQSQAYKLMEERASYGTKSQLFDYTPLDMDQPVVVLVLFAHEPVLTHLQRSICKDYLAIGVNLIVVLTQSTRLSPEDAGVPRGPKAVILRENSGFDFASWHEAHQLLGPFNTVPRVILTNDSVVPTSVGLRDVVDEHCRAEADWLFSTRNHEIRPHGQSFLMSYRPDAVQDHILDLLDSTGLATKQEVIEQKEVPLAERVAALGMSVGYLHDRDSYASGYEDLNPSLHSARRLVENGFSLVKAEYLLKELEQMESWVEGVLDIRRLWEIQCHLTGRYPHRSSPDRVGLSIPVGTPLQTRRGILLYGHNADVGGAQALLLGLARSLSRVFNYDVVILLESGGSNLQQFQDTAPTFVLDGNIALLDEIVTMCLACGMDRVIFNTVVPLARMSAFYSAGFRTTALVHEMAESIRILNLGGPVTNALNALEHVVFPSEVVRYSLEENLDVLTANPVIRSQGHFRISRSRLPYDTPRLAEQPEENEAKQGKVVLCVGTVEHRKGFDRFCAVAKAFRRNHPKADTRFLWVGSPQPLCNQRAEFDAAQRDNVIDCLPNLGEADLLAIYQSADAYFFASRHDAMPYAVIDAFHTGVPVVGFDGTGGCDTLIRQFGTLLADDAQPEDCVAALEVLLGSDRTSERTDAGRRYVEEKLDFDAYAADIMALFGDYNPKLTVAVPNYCHRRFLPARLRSILEQDYRYFDLLLLDDCSSDGSVEVLEQFRAHYSPFTSTIYNQTNSGNSYLQWEKAIAAANGELLWIAESDDACARSFLSHMIQPFKKPDVSIAFSQTNFLDEQGRLTGTIQKDFNWIHPYLWNGSYIVAGQVEIDRCLSRANTIINVSSVVFRRNAIPPLDHVLDYRFAGDWELYLRMCGEGQVAFCRQAQNYFRRSDTTQTSKMSYSDRFFTEHNMIMQTVADVAGSTAAEKTADTIRRHWNHSHPNSDVAVEYLKLNPHQNGKGACRQ